MNLYVLLQKIWDEIGESDEARDKMLIQLAAIAPALEQLACLIYP